MPPHNICQWTVYVGVVVLGGFVSAGVQSLFMDVLLNREKLAKQLGREQDGKYTEPKLQRWVGAIEIVLYASSLVFGKVEFIPVWFATKYVASYRHWNEKAVGRTFYNRSLFGSGLNVVLGLLTGKFALWAISHFGS